MPDAAAAGRFGYREPGPAHRAEAGEFESAIFRHADQGNTARRLCAVGRLCCL